MLYRIGRDKAAFGDTEGRGREKGNIREERNNQREGDVCNMDEVAGNSGEQQDHYDVSRKIT